MAHPNKYKYLKAPTIEQIEAAVAKVGVSEAQFERHYGLYEGAIKRVRMGIRSMPPKYWHLFFETSQLFGASVGAKSPLQTTASRQKPKAASRLAGLS